MNVIWKWVQMSDVVRKIRNVICIYLFYISIVRYIRSLDPWINDLGKQSCNKGLSNPVYKELNLVDSSSFSR